MRGVGNKPKESALEWVGVFFCFGGCGDGVAYALAEAEGEGREYVML